MHCSYEYLLTRLTIIANRGNSVGNVNIVGIVMQWVHVTLHADPAFTNSVGIPYRGYVAWSAIEDKIHVWELYIIHVGHLIIDVDVVMIDADVDDMFQSSMW